MNDDKQIDKGLAGNGMEERSGAQGAKREFSEPKLAFIEPKLTSRGDLRDITGNFGGFSP